MAKNGYLVQISTNNQPLKIIDTGNSFKTSLLNGSKYSLDLTNNNSFPVDAYLKIDGKKMGSYRIIPSETIKIIRPCKRKKDLCFLKKTEEFSRQGLFKNNNQNLGQIEVIFRSGVKYDSDDEDINYPFNRQVYRLEEYEYNSDYMNKYKREKPVCKFNYKELYTECGDEPECYEESPPEPGCLSEPEEDCCPNYECEEIRPIESTLEELDIQEENITNGFTAYGDDIETKYKTYQALDYDSDETKIIVNLFIKRYEAL